MLNHMPNQKVSQMLSVMHSLNCRMTEGVLTVRNGSHFVARFVGASNSLTMLPIVVFSPVLKATLLRHSCIASTSLACSCTRPGSSQSKHK